MGVISLQLQLFLLIAIGVVCERKGFIGPRGRQTLSDFLLFAILPCNILNSYTNLIDLPEAFTGNCLLLFFLSAIIHGASVIGGKILFRKYPAEREKVLSYALICSNSGFIGVPVVEALFGSLGVMYASVYMIPLRFTLWTAGIGVFLPINGKDAAKKILQNPCIICTFAGLAFLAIPFPLPAFVQNTLLSMSRCLIPVSMIMIGSILSSVPIRAMLSKTVLWYTLIRLVLFPGAVYLLLLPFRLEPMVVGIALLITGMPAGGLTSILADKYGSDTEFASHLVFTSTLLSMVTIPAWMLLTNGLR